MATLQLSLPVNRYDYSLINTGNLSRIFTEVNLLSLLARGLLWIITNRQFSLCTALTLSSFPEEQTHTETSSSRLLRHSGEAERLKWDHHKWTSNFNCHLSPNTTTLSLQTCFDACTLHWARARLISPEQLIQPAFPYLQGDGWGPQPGLGFDKRNFPAVTYCAQVWFSTHVLTFKTCKGHVT